MWFKETSIKLDASLKEPFVEMYKILEQLTSHNNIQPAIKWALLLFLFLSPSCFFTFHSLNDKCVHLQTNRVTYITRAALLLPYLLSSFLLLSSILTSLLFNFSWARSKRRELEEKENFVEFHLHRLHYIQVSTSPPPLLFFSSPFHSSAFPLLLFSILLFYSQLFLSIVLPVLLPPMCFALSFLPHVLFSLLSCAASASFYPSFILLQALTLPLSSPLPPLPFLLPSLPPLTTRSC